MKRRTLIAAIVLLGTAATPITSQASPVLSGRILGGFFIAGAPGCSLTADCRAWAASGCNPSLSGNDPAVLTSIEDVSDLASTRRVFDLQVGSPGISWTPGGVVVEFWGVACAVVARIPAETGPIRPGATTFMIPENAKWMTATASDSVNLIWTLT